jgi:hypothetical protein
MTPETTGPRGARLPAGLKNYPLLKATPGFERGQDSGLLGEARIITTRGLRPVDGLAPGDLLVSRGNGVIAVRRIEQQTLVARAVYVIAGSIGHRQTDRDTMLPAGQPVLVRDWRARAFSGCPEMIVRADSLVDGEYVRDIGWQPMTVYRIFCDSPQVFYADGMELGSADWAAAAASRS